MRVIDCGPISYNEQKLNQKIHFNIFKDSEKEIRKFIENNVKIIEPKSVYEYLKIVKIDGDIVKLENGEILKGIILGDLLIEGQIFAPFVVTIGTNIDEQISKVSRENAVLGWILSEVGNYALDIARNNLKNIVKRQLGDIVSRFSPGVGTQNLFGIEQQAAIFKILEPFKNIGVKLTKSYMMIPSKSVSGIFAALNEYYSGCQYCSKICKDREVPLKGKYRANYARANSISSFSW